MTPNEVKDNLPDFIKFAEGLKGDEKGEAQTYLDHLFRAFGHEGAIEAGATFEYRIAKKPGSHQLELLTNDLPKKPKGGKKFADLLWPERVLIEMKSRGIKLEKHYDQLFEYWSHIVPKRPPYAVLCNFDEFWIYDFNQQLFEPVEKVSLTNLDDRIWSFAFLFTYDHKPTFNNNLVEVTQSATAHLAWVFSSLIKRGTDRDAAQHFILQLLVGMVAEDVGLLPHNILTELLDECIEDKKTGYDLIGGLFRQMNDPQAAKGGRFKDVAYFNGGLFEVVQPVELSDSELQRLHRAATEDWSKVRPEIFGSLFERSLEHPADLEKIDDPSERHRWGAHFTNEVDIHKVVGPTIIEPFYDLIKEADKGNPATRRKKLRSILKDLRLFRVLDPACGSGNFLYVAFRSMRRLERDILLRLRDAGEPDETLVSRVSPRQLYGIDLHPVAVEIARVTLMLAKELEIIDAQKLADEDGLDFEEKPLPLDNLDDQIICGDALFTDWPRCEAIIGNPPFQSKNKAQEEFGAAYLDKVRREYPAVSGRADFCVYWFKKAHDHLRDGQRAGLVGTNSIRQNYSREGGLDYIVANGGTITDAVSTQVWSGDAVVHVSIVNWIKGSYYDLNKLSWQNGDNLDSPWEIHELPFISSALSAEVDVTQAEKLNTNAQSKACYQGQTHGHEGFLLEPEEAHQIIKKDPRSREVIFPFLIADVLIGKVTSQTDRYVIDFRGHDIVSASTYNAIQEIRDRVLPKRKESALKEEERNKEKLSANPNARTNKHHANFLRRWWQLSYNRDELMNQIAVVPRYFVCGQVTKRPIFEFISSEIHPNAALIVFPVADDYSFGIMQSGIHWEWFMARCSSLKGDPRYTSNTVFDSFVWPQSPTEKQVRAVADAAIELRQLRNDLMAKLQISFRDLYRSLDEVGENPLRNAHDKLDKAVIAAYAMPDDADILAFLLDLNSVCAAKEANGESIQGPGFPLKPDQLGDFITEDCIKPLPL